MLRYTRPSPAPLWSNFNGNFASSTGPKGNGLGSSYILGGAATLAKGLTTMLSNAFHNLNQRAAQPPSQNQNGGGFASFTGGSSSPIFGGSTSTSNQSLFGLNSTPEAQKANAGVRSFIRGIFSPYADLEKQKEQFRASQEFQQHRVHPYFKVNDFGNSTPTTSNFAPHPNDQNNNNNSINRFMGGSFGGGSFSFGGGNMGGGGGNPFGGGGGGAGGGGGGQGSLFDKMLEWCSVSHAKDIARRMGIDMRDIKFTFGANGECNVKVDAPNATPLQIAQLGEAVQQECPVARFRKTTLKSEDQKMKWELLSQR